jgi:DNA-binding CsgD family transcriptional regulator/tetratricopeptide (TPR) repeat protein
MVMHERIPLIGRQRELALLTSALDGARKGKGSVHIVAGEGGVGKTRLSEALRERAVEREFTTVLGRAFPVETGIPYAIFGDGFVPLLRAMPPATLQTMSRGAAAELTLLFPTLRTEGTPAPRAGEAAELKPRIFDAFSQLLTRLAAKAPMLVVLENLHWADPSSLDLFHFLARGASAQPLVLLATYNDAQRESHRSLRNAEQSLLSLGVLARHTLPPLTRAETTQLVLTAFGETAEAIGDFADRVHERTRGNPFFIEEVLKMLLDSGRLRREGDRWTGWVTEQLALPGNIRDALQVRYDRLSEAAQKVVVVAAVVGAQVPHDLLERLAGLDGQALLTVVDELRKERIFEEIESPDGPAYLFTHPMLQEMLYLELSRARVRALHAEIADALETMYGERALANAEEIAVHLRRAESPAQAERAVRYLTAAGEIAIGRGAHREAVDSLNAALALLDRSGTTAGIEPVLDSLGRARHRLGDYAGASTLWRRAIALAESRGELSRVASLERRLGLAALRLGDFPRALEHHERGLGTARRARDEGVEASLHLARSAVMMEVGDGDEAERGGRKALEIAERLGEPRLLARVHQALQAIAVWRGPQEGALEHGARALEIAAQTGDLRTAWQAEWVLAYHAGLTGDREGTGRRIAEASRLAEELRSPVLRILTAEVTVEYRSGIGEWDAALALADRSIEEARVFGQRLLLPRLLVWSALVLCGRGELEKAKARIDEAWAISGADRAEDGGPLNVHLVVPAHMGLAYYHLYRRDYRLSLEIAERGLAIADRTGYAVWAVHRLLPLAAEASLWLRDWERSDEYGTRLREAADQLGHPLAGAWSDACFALARMLQGDKAGAIEQLRSAADALDAIPFVEHAARLRRKFVDALLDSGDQPTAEAELYRIHGVFARLGAKLSFDEVREKMRDLKMKLPPIKPQGEPGWGDLTPSEARVAKLVAAGKSNREIGEELGSSHRTVGTHLANVYKKLRLRTRGQLAAFMREQGIA